MKIGIRKPSLKKSLKARTTGKLKRKIKRQLIPGYGKKGMGWIKDPKKALYNKVYHKTTIRALPLGILLHKKSTKAKPTQVAKGITTVSKSAPALQQPGVYSPTIHSGEPHVMKICSYCNTENENSATVCRACGANVFKKKCGNCGFTYETGEYCPNCGVKFGVAPKICPACRTEYYSPSCPQCGYNPAKQVTEPNVVYVEEAPQPKRRLTWLWVLGWIFVFPVPLMILIIRNKTMKTWAKVAIIVGAWLLYLFIMALGSAEEDSPEQSPSAYEYSNDAQAGSLE